MEPFTKPSGYGGWTGKTVINNVKFVNFGNSE